MLSAGLFAIFKFSFTNNETLLNKNRCAKVCQTLFIIRALLQHFFQKGRLHGGRTLASFFNAAILSRVWEWSDSGANTRLRTRLP